ncbi:ATP-binding protein [Solibacillus sp. FSL H8-0538]|uniref:ATP-binding protein n=1 Tax=Solibacillus sp. FSL H8-0538 TaxID=2921400 RepID=UPI0030F862B0
MLLREEFTLETKQPISKSSRTLVIILFIALLTALGSELKIMPFEDAPFRFGLGSIIFFLALLIQPVPIIKTGIITGFTVVAFRALVDTLYTGNPISQQWVEHFPAALFYIVFAVCLKTINIEQIKSHPFMLGLYGIAFEVLANTMEQLTMTLFITQQRATYDEFLLFVAVAFLRSFFVVGFYSTITVSEQKKQMQQLLNIHSELYVESLYLQKSMAQIEQITADSFQLYKQLKPVDTSFSSELLRISQEIHEIKKDTERIYAGLSKIVTTKRSDTFLLSDLIRFVVEANENYANLLNKRISFTTACSTDMRTHEHIALLALLNNLVANAVEAIEQVGSIELTIHSTPQKTTFVVKDDGQGIKASMLSVIFDPGFTSKFNEAGIASTGIGLSHVQTIISRLQGNITVISAEWTTFTVTVPTKKLCSKEATK